MSIKRFTCICITLFIISILSSSSLWSQQCEDENNQIFTTIRHKYHNGIHHNPYLVMLDTMIQSLNSFPLNSSAENNFLNQLLILQQEEGQMAQFEIQNGKDILMLNSAKNILRIQQKEGSFIPQLIKKYPPASPCATTEYRYAMNFVMLRFIKALPQDNQMPQSIDCQFAKAMIVNNSAIIDLTTSILKFNPSIDLSRYAKQLIVAKKKETKSLNDYLRRNCK